MEIFRAKLMFNWPHRWHMTPRPWWHSKMCIVEILPTAKTNTQDVLPIWQNQFGHIGCNYLRSYYTLKYLMYII